MLRKKDSYWRQMCDEERRKTTGVRSVMKKERQLLALKEEETRQRNIHMNASTRMLSVDFGEASA